MKRIFIALKIEAGESLLKMIALFKTGLANESIKWVGIENIHITLVFLGNTPEEQIDIISSMLQKKCERFGEFEIEIKGAGVFKKQNEPRVIWTGINHSERLLKLNESLILGLKDSGIMFEGRTYNPHLTLGRIKNITNKIALNNLIDKYHNEQLQHVNVREVILFESILLQPGPVYKQLGIFRLQ